MIKTFDNFDTSFGIIMVFGKLICFIQKVIFTKFSKAFLTKFLQIYQKFNI